MGLFDWFRKPKPRALPASNPREALAGFVESLHSDYEVWYAKSVRRVNRWYWILQMAVLLSGFLTSVVAAVVEQQTFASWGKWVLVVMPAVGSLAAACLLQFRTYELWRLREQGRVAFQDLAITGQRLFPAAKTDEERSAIHADLQKKATEIEQTQNDSYFGLFRADFISKYEPAARPNQPLQPTGLASPPSGT
jgi:hypothetical protein